MNLIKCAFSNSLWFLSQMHLYGGINELWKPVMNLHDFTEYKVSIFNRLGQLVYELNDNNQFWDGTYQATGELASVGVYIYWMEFKTVNGEYFNRKGHITLIR